MIVPAATAPGNPGENTLLPDADREIENLGLKPKEIALDGGFGHLKSDAQVAGIEPERVFVSGRREPGTPRTKWGSLSQAGFDGDLGTRTFRPGERRASADASTEEVPR